MPELDVRCRCCGVLLAPGPRAEIRRCILCDLCDRRHGDELQLHVMGLVRAGRITWGHALARMLIDDAHHAGMLGMVVENGALTATLTVPEPVPRWRVVIGRAISRGELPELNLVLKVTLARYIGKRATLAVREEMRRELCEALSTLDDSITDITVSCHLDTIDAEHLMIEITGKRATLGAVAFDASAGGADAAKLGAPAPELPADIMSRPRGQA